MNRTPHGKPDRPKHGPQPASPAGARPTKGAAASRLRAQTRKVLGKHYRAKYGVR